MFSLFEEISLRFLRYHFQENIGQMDNLIIKMPLKMAKQLYNKARFFFLAHATIATSMWKWETNQGKIFSKITVKSLFYVIILKNIKGFKESC